MEMIQCMKCGWTQLAAGGSVALIMIDDHKFDDGCDGEVRRSGGKAKR